MFLFPGAAGGRQVTGFNDGGEAEPNNKQAEKSKCGS